MENTRYYFHGDRLAEIREERKLLQKELAAKIGVKTATITAYENNHVVPSTQRLVLIAEELDLSLDYLFGVHNEPLSYKNPNYVLLPKDSPENLKSALEELLRIMDKK